MNTYIFDTLNPDLIGYPISVMLEITAGDVAREDNIDRVKFTERGLVYDYKNTASKRV